MYSPDTVCSRRSEQSHRLGSSLLFVILILIASTSVKSDEVPIELLDQLSEFVNQKTHGIRDEERPVINQLLLAIRRTDESVLKRDAADNLQLRKSSRASNQPPYSPFADLLKQPDESIGLPFTLRGHIRRLEQIDTLKDGDRELPVYEAWLFTEESQGNPWVVLATEIPADLKPGTELNERIEATGYFVKLATYQAQDARRVAPMILAPRLHRVVIADNKESNLLSGGILVAVLLGCLWCWTLYREQSQRRRLKQRLESPALEIDSSHLDSTPPDSGSGP